MQIFSLIFLFGFSKQYSYQEIYSHIFLDDIITMLQKKELLKGVAIKSSNENMLHFLQSRLFICH